MNDRPKNIAASIQDRLATEAKKMNRPFGEVLQYYGMERFLYRLSKTHYVNSFILKGGLVFYSWDLPLRRPTKDIVFLSSLENRKSIIKQAITTTLSISVPEDGVIFDAASLIIEEAAVVDADRAGIRAKFLGYLGGMKIPIHIDFGFSDEITSEAQSIEYPTVLHGMSAPQLYGYPVESVVSEKFHAVQRFAGIPSRWKDYYDIWLISESFELDDQSLQRAIAGTFENRKTALPSGRPVSLAVELASRHQKDWKNFLDKSGLAGNQVDELQQLTDRIWNFLEWPLEGLNSSQGPRPPRRWKPHSRKWE